MTGTSKSIQIEDLQNALTETIERVHAEKDDRKKKKLILQISKYNSKLNKLKSGKLLSRQAKRDLIAYSFIAPNFIGFCVFTLITIVFAFARHFLLQKRRKVLRQHLKIRLSIVSELCRLPWSPLWHWP